MGIGKDAVIAEQDGKISQPFGNLASGIHEVLARVFSNVNTQFRKHAILTPKNVVVDSINHRSSKWTLRPPDGRYDGRWCLTKR